MGVMLFAGAAGFTRPKADKFPNQSACAAVEANMDLLEASNVSPGAGFWEGREAIALAALHCER